jgi:CO/xanthine dehydrogenase FAD-binding subunit
MPLPQRDCKPVKPPPFAYVAATSVAEAVAALAAQNGEAKVIAGGQSLVPMLNFRLLAPSALVDINGIKELDYIEDSDGGLRIGALTRHYTMLTSPKVAAAFPIVSEVMRHVAHLAIRNRGTIGGSLSHADPAAELPMMAVLLDATLTLAGPDGEREVAAQDFFDGALTTVLAEDELLTMITLPPLPAGHGWGFHEFAQRAGDFALAAAAAIFTVADGKATNLRLAVMGVDENPARIGAAEAALEGQPVSDDTIAAAVAAVRDAVDPPEDLHGSADYRRHVVGGLMERAIRDAWQRGNDASGGGA